MRWLPGPSLVCGSGYEEIERRADRMLCTAEHDLRDRYPVGDGSVCLACLTEAVGGTACAVTCARRCGLRTVNITGPDKG